MQTLHVHTGDASLEVQRYSGVGPLVCLLPGLGGGLARVAGLAGRLAGAGCQPIAVNPRGAGGSTGRLDTLTMADLADDVAAVIERFGGPATVVGNAFGNRVARNLAVRHPSLVSAVVLVCAGGEVAPDPDAARALSQFLDDTLDTERRLDAARRALFAPGHDVDPGYIDPDRSAAAAQAQIAASRAETDDSWVGGGSAPMLVVQGLDDLIAPPENGHRLQRRWPDRVEVVDVADAGHAILDEQPEAVARAVVDFVTRHAAPADD